MRLRLDGHLMAERDVLPCMLDFVADTHSGPPGDTPGETPEQMSARVDRVIAKIREIHAKAEAEAASPEEADHADVIIFSHGHFTRSFIARWCDFPIRAGYHFAADAGGVSTSRTSLVISADKYSWPFWATSTIPSRSPVSYFDRDSNMLTPQPSWVSTGTPSTSCRASKNSVSCQDYAWSHLYQSCL